MFTMEEVRIANATSRSNGASAKNKDGSIRAIVPKYVAEHIGKECSILDFGAGKGALHTKWLREEGFNVTAYDFGDNVVDGLHDENALDKQYDIVFASNVLNVQSSIEMLFKTIRQAYSGVKPGGYFICNYPASPRKLDVGALDIYCALRQVFDTLPKRVGGTASAPLWKVQKPYEN